MVTPGCQTTLSNPTWPSHWGLDIKQCGAARSRNGSGQDGTTGSNENKTHELKVHAAFDITPGDVSCATESTQLHNEVCLLPLDGQRSTSLTSIVSMSSSHVLSNHASRRHSLESRRHSLEIDRPESFVTFPVGARVCVVDAFHTDSDPPVRLRKGTTGSVKLVDDCGDAMIAFDGFNDHEWVGKSKFGHLEILGSAQIALRRMHHRGTLRVRRVGSAISHQKIYTSSVQLIICLVMLLSGSALFLHLFPAQSKLEGDELQPWGVAYAPAYWIILISGLTPVMTGIAFGPPRPGVSSVSCAKLCMRNMIKLALFCKFLVLLYKDISYAMIVLDKMAKLDLFCHQWFVTLHNIFIAFAISPNISASMSAAAIADLYSGRVAWIEAHARLDTRWLGDAELNTDATTLLMKEQGVVFRIYEICGRGTYVNIVFALLVPYLVPAFVLYGYIFLPLFLLLVLLSSLLGTSIPTFFGKRSQDCDDSQAALPTYSVQIEALRAAYSRSTKRCPEDHETVLACYAEEASSVGATGTTKSSWQKYFFLPLVAGVMPPLLVTVAARLYTLGFNAYTYALSRSIMERTSQVYFGTYFKQLEEHRANICAKLEGWRLASYVCNQVIAIPQIQ